MSSDRSSEKPDRIIAQARKDQEERDKGYRERALRMYPWVCGRCGREFTRQNLRELTVHHRDHNHDHNPLDGSNWELLGLYCHDNEHSRYMDSDYASSMTNGQKNIATHKAFSDLVTMLKQKK
jgi:hypothetical protein